MIMKFSTAIHSRSRPNHHGSGTVVLMVMIILGISVMLAAIFVSTMATYKASGTKQTARQLALQAATAGAAYAMHLVMTDYAEARTANIPQRYLNGVPATTGDPGNRRGQPLPIPGFIPANPTDRIGTNWLVPFQGRIDSSVFERGYRDTGTTLGYTAGGGINQKMTRFEYADNQHSSLSGADVTRRTSVDSMPSSQEVMMQYYDWTDSWFGNDGGTISSVQQRSITPIDSGKLARPKWWTTAYYDADFQPLAFTSANRDIAAYETRYSIMPVPLDGAVNINFSDKIRSATTGGRYRLGLKNPYLPTGRTTELSNAVITAAASSADTDFANDQQAYEIAIAAGKPYTLKNTTTYSYQANGPTEAYQVSAADIDWLGAGFPLIHQYAAGFANMLGAMCIEDGNPSVTMSRNATYSWNLPKYTSSWTRTPAGNPGKPTVVLTPTPQIDGTNLNLAKSTAGMGRLTNILNTALGQGYKGNIFGYDLIGAGDYWFSPKVPGSIQVGSVSSWRQLHANLGFTTMTKVATANDRDIEITCLALSPFGNGLDRSISPDRNRGGPDLADIDCPWYVNIMMMNQLMAKGMIAGLDTSWMCNYNGLNGLTNSGDAYNTNQNNLLPTPPDKSDPLDATKIAMWDDGVARTGADGVEGGAIPPVVLGGTDTILGTAYLRPAKNGGTDSNGNATTDRPYYFKHDAFASDSNGETPSKVWKNPVRDEMITWYQGTTTYTCSASAAAAAPFPLGSFIVIKPGIPDTEAGTYKITSGTGALFPANYTAVGAPVNKTSYVNGGVYTPIPTSVGWVYTVGTARMERGMSGSMMADIALTSSSSGNKSGEDRVEMVVGSGAKGWSNSFENLNGSETELDTNMDSKDERLSWQADIAAALIKTLVDVNYDRIHGKKINGTSAAHGYEMIEDIETVFLGHLGIAVRYKPSVSHASTVGASASDYEISNPNPVAAPATTAAKPGSSTWVLGQFNQLALFANQHTEIMRDRSLDTTSLAFPHSFGINEEGRPGQIGYRNYDPANPQAVVTIEGGGGKDAKAIAAVSGGVVTSVTLISGGSGYVNPLRVRISIPGNRGSGAVATASAAVTPGPVTSLTLVSGGTGYDKVYQPTWAALSRTLEHRLNDVRMSLFGTPALDLNKDGLTDATVYGMVNAVVQGNDPPPAGYPFPGADFRAGVVTNPTFDPSVTTDGVQVHFSSTGRWFLGRNHYWRLFVKSEIWDRRTSKLVSEAALEQALVIDPNGDGDLGDSHTIFSRPHGNPITVGREGPTREGRTEATLP